MFKKAWRIFWEKIDWFLLLSCVAMSAFGVVLLMGLYRSQWLGTLRLTGGNIRNQIIAIVLGVLVAVILANINYRAIVDRWLWHVPFFYLLFFSTFIFGIGTELRPDATRWLLIPVIGTVQPSEFLKVAFIVTFAYHIYKTEDRFNHPLNILALLAHAAIPIGLVQIQGDTGTAMIFGLIFLSMLFVAGIKWYYIAAAGASLVAIVPIVWIFVLQDFQRGRILALFGLASPVEAGGIDPTFQSRLAAQAIASGGLSGHGIFNPYPRYVPEMHNDFIFAFLAHAWGFLGAAAVIAAFMLIGAKIIHSTAIANDKQGQAICAGIFAMIVGQAAVNIFVNLSILPVIGISLPFLSSGGSSLLATFVGLGLYMSVYKHTKRRVKVESFLP